MKKRYNMITQKFNKECLKGQLVTDETMSTYSPLLYQLSYRRQTIDEIMEKTEIFLEAKFKMKFIWMISLVNQTQFYEESLWLCESKFKIKIMYKVFHLYTHMSSICMYAVTRRSQRCVVASRLASEFVFRSGRQNPWDSKDRQLWDAM